MSPYKTNAFIDLNGIPYLLGDYMNRAHFQMVDRGMIKSGIFVDTSDPMRAIIDVQIDDIGKKNDDGDPNSLTNKKRVEMLVEAVHQMALARKTQFPVLWNSIVARVNYRIESRTTGNVIRSMAEDVRITNRGCFLDISAGGAVDDQAILSRFADTIVSSINEFTHGTNRMILRITRISLFYEMLRPTPDMPNVRTVPGATISSAYDGTYPSLLDYHKAVQPHHFLGGDEYHSNDITPPDWTFFEYFYHFSDHGHHIDLHKQQLYDPRIQKVLIPCGVVDVNRSFVINPGHRIIFKFSIWKNDLVLMNDTMVLAKILRAPVYGGHHPHCEDDYFDHMDMHYCGDQMDYSQNAAINKLAEIVGSLQDKVNQLIGSGEDEEEKPTIEEDVPVIPVLPEKPTDPTDPIKALYDMMTKLQEKVDQLAEYHKDEQSSPSTSLPEEEPEEEEDAAVEDTLEQNGLSNNNGNPEVMKASTVAVPQTTAADPSSFMEVHPYENSDKE